VDEIKKQRPVTTLIWEAGLGTRLFLVLGIVVALAAIAALFSSYLPAKIALGVLAGIILFVIIYHNIQIGIILFLALNLTIPQAGPGLDIGIRAPVVGERGIHFNLHEIVMALVLVAWLIQAFLKKTPWREKSPLILPVVIYVVVSILACFVGLINDAKPGLVAFRWVRTVSFFYIFFVILNNVRTRKHYDQLVITFLVCTFAVMAFGVVQQIMGQGWSEMVAEKLFGKILGYPADVNYVAGAGAGQVYRINSSFLHPNIFGGYLVFALPFYISLLWYFKRTWIRFFLLIGLGMNLFCLVFTGSRASWIAAGCIVLLYGLLGLLDRRIVLVVAIAVLIVVLMVAIIKPPDFVKQRFVGASAKLATSGRLMQYQLAIDFFMENPILGLGIGMEGQKMVESNMRRTWASVENVYLTYLVSEGLVGLTSFLLLLIFYWIILLWALNRSGDDPFVHFNAEALMLGMVGFAVANLFGAWLLFAVPMITLFWCYLGMAGSLYNIFREGREDW